MDARTVFDRILTDMTEGILFIDNENRIVFSNEKALELGGADPRTIIGKSVLHCHPPTIQKHVLKVIEFVKKNPNRSQQRIVHKGRKYFEINYSGVFGEDNKCLGVVAVSRDITDKHILNEKLKKVTITDHLTQLYNRRHFYATLAKEMKRSQRQKHPMSLIVLDLDGFKSYNDYDGHILGDKALRTIGKIIKKSIRKHVDFPFRYGGDEFTIILPEADGRKACEIAERLRVNVENLNLGDITLSIGIAELLDTHDQKTLLAEADRAMYESKGRGGNKITAVVGEYS